MAKKRNGSKRARVDGMQVKPSNDMAEGKKVWKKVHVDHDALLSTTDQDWGGFLELEVLEDVSEAADLIQREKEAKAKAKGSAVSEGDMDDDKKKKQKKKKQKKRKLGEPSDTLGERPPQTSESLPASKPNPSLKLGRKEGTKVKVNMKKWLPYNLDGKIMDSLRSLEFCTPTPIQRDSLPISLAGDTDIIGAAQTGSGKTLAFALPIIQRLLREKKHREKKMVKAGHTTSLSSAGTEETGEGKNKLKGEGEGDEEGGKQGVRALVVSPTRELALQIKQHIDSIALRHGIYTACIVGGMSQQKQERVLKQSPQIVVGTPGRLWELIENEFGALASLKGLSFFVLDEADRMVEQGHYQELTYIIDRVPFSARLQTFVFSATLTMPKTQLNKKTTKSIKKSKTSVSSIMQKIKFREKIQIFDLTKSRKVAAKLEESVVHCSEESRMEFLYFILATTVGRTLVFCNTISAIRTLLSILTNLGLPVSAIHAQQQQRQRLKALDNFKTGKKSILLATDVAARGLDIAEVRCVIQYQLPDSSDTYVHRAGRTARAEADGLNILFVGPKNAKHFLRLRYSLKMSDDLPQFPVDHAVMPQVRARMSLAKRIDEISRLEKKQKAKGDWLRRNAEAAGIMLDDDDNAFDDEEVARSHSESRKKEQKLKNLQRQLLELLSRPLQTTFSNKYLNPETITKAESELQSKSRLVSALKTKKKIKAEDVLNRRGSEALHSIRNSKIRKQKKK